MAVNNIPRPRSFPQQLGAMLDATTSRVGIHRLRVGGPILSLLEAAAQADVRNSQDIFNLLAAADLDNSEGLALDRLGADEDTPRFILAKATGAVTISDSSFSRLGTKVYQGASAPIVGSVAINVESTTGWPASGSIYLGRGTPNIEGPLTYASITDHGSYATLNLSTPTTRFHNKGEDVVLAQGGNRVIDAGQLVATAQGALSSASQFSVVFEATIPDGETEVVNVSVVATVAGASHNAVAESVREFVGGAPFSGAVVSNPRPFITGRDTETDNDYRDRIRDARNSRTRGTDLAIENAVIGATSETESKRISSASLVRRPGEASALFIDDGSGYEEISTGVGIEVVSDLAAGGERDFQTLNRPVAKAHLISRNTAPFALSDSAKLSFDVGGVVTTHTFDVSAFTGINAASAYEVAASINADPGLLWAARTLDSGARLVIVAKAESNEDIVIVPVAAPDTDANAALLFPTSRRYTSLLYKNDRLLSKDGIAASLRSRPFVEWNTFSGAQTLTIAVDQTPVTTYTWTDQDFVDAATSYSGVGKNSVGAWAAVINRKIPGITAVVEGDRIVLTSNRGTTSEAAVNITGGTLVAQFLFEVGAATGAARDYTLDRGTGQIVTSAQLAAGDRLTLGSDWTRAFIEAKNVAPITVATDFDAWFVADGSTTVVTHGVGAATPLTATVERVLPHGLHIAITAGGTAEVFANVAVGDWMVLSDPDTDLPSALRKAWRVIEVREAGGLLNVVVVEKAHAAAPRTKAGVCALVPVGADLPRVLVTGGYTKHSNTAFVLWSHFGTAITAECEVFDPNTGTWTATGQMSVPRAGHTASILPDGRVLVCGGRSSAGTPVDSTEIWDPTTGLWTAGPVMSTTRADHTATVLNSGRVLVAGGTTAAGAATSSTQEYNQGTNTFINAASLGTARAGHGAVLLPAGAGVAGAEAGNVLVVGGIDVLTPLASVERYDVAAPAWSAKATMGAGFERAFFGLAVADTQKVLAVGDSEHTGITPGTDRTASWQVYTVDTDSWSASADVETGWRFADKAQGAIKSPTNAAVICYGGVFDSGGLKSLRHKRFDGATSTWSTLTDSGLAAAAVEITLPHGVALNGGASPDRVMFFGGASQRNLTGAAVAGDVVGPHLAVAEVWNDDTSAWEVPDESTALNADTLDNRGIAFVRTPNDLQRVTIGAAANYTATTLAALLNSALRGITASVYRTSTLRVETNSYGDNGDLAMVAVVNSSGLPLPSGEVASNVVGHFASTEAQNTGLGVPAAWQAHLVIAEASTPHTADAELSVYVPKQIGLYDVAPPAVSTVLGLRRGIDGINPAFWQAAWTAGNDRSVAEYGNTKNSRNEVAAVRDDGDRTTVGLRAEPHQKFVTDSPVVFSLPYAMGPRDDLIAVIDEDTDAKRFVIPMWRRLKPSEITYSAQVALRDFDAGDVGLQTTFGADFDFDDYALYMKARVKSHSADATRRMLWRFWRHGPEGNAVSVRYTYPDLAEAELAVEVDTDQTTPTNDLNGPLKTFVDVILGSGAAKTADTLSTTCRLGLARCNGADGVWDNYAITGFSVVEAARGIVGGLTRLQIQVPNNGVIAQGPQGSGLIAGDVLWFEATNPTPTTLFSGAFSIVSVDPFDAMTGLQNIYVPGSTLDDGTATLAATPNLGTVSFDNSGEITFDPAVVTGDLLHLAPGDLPASYTGSTSRVAGSGRQYLWTRALDLSTAGAQTTPVWTPLLDPSDVSVFGGPTQDATAIAAAVNALATGDDSTSPLSVTVIGTGAGVIAEATWDELDSATARYDLTDGVNYVQRTIEPPTIVDETEFLLKNEISSDLQSDSDWANEDVRIAPLLTSDVVDWLLTPAISGLFSAAEVTASRDGTAVQIASLTAGSAGAVEIQGGTSSLATAAVIGAAKLITRTGLQASTCIVTTRRVETDGFIGGRWVRIDNTDVLPKLPFWNSATNVNSVAADGTWTLDVSPFSVLKSIDEVRVHIESIGGYTAIHIPYTANDEAPSISECPEFGYLYLAAPTLNRSDLPEIAAANTGTFRIIRTTRNHLAITIWVENNNALDQISVCTVKTLSADSMVAGDVWTVSSAVFGDANRGSWSVTEVGAVTPGGLQYETSNFRVDILNGAPGVVSAVTAFGTSAGLVQHHQGAPARLFKEVLSVVPNQVDGDFADIQFTTSAGYQAIGASPGSIVTALDKLAFNSGVMTGVDGYSYSTGLIQEANRIVYGDAADRATYPGYAAAGANILTQGAFVKRMRLALSLRVQSGLASDDLADRVRSAVAAVINRTGVGKDIALSDITTAAGSVHGVIAVAVVAPTFNSTNDVIPGARGQRPLVLDLRADIQIAFVGE